MIKSYYLNGTERLYFIYLFLCFCLKDRCTDLEEKSRFRSYSSSLSYKWSALVWHHWIQSKRWLADAKSYLKAPEPFLASGLARASLLILKRLPCVDILLKEGIPQQEFLQHYKDCRNLLKQSLGITRQVMLRGSTLNVTSAKVRFQDFLKNSLLMEFVMVMMESEIPVLE